MVKTGAKASVFYVLFRFCQERKGAVMHRKRVLRYTRREGHNQKAETA